MLHNMAECSAMPHTALEVTPRDPPTLRLSGRCVIWLRAGHSRVCPVGGAHGGATVAAERSRDRWCVPGWRKRGASAAAHASVRDGAAPTTPANVARRLREAAQSHRCQTLLTHGVHIAACGMALRAGNVSVAGWVGGRRCVARQVGMRILDVWGSSHRSGLCVREVCGPMSPGQRGLTLGGARGARRVPAAMH